MYCAHTPHHALSSSFNKFVGKILKTSRASVSLSPKIRPLPTQCEAGNNTATVSDSDGVHGVPRMDVPTPSAAINSGDTTMSAADCTVCARKYTPLTVQDGTGTQREARAAGERGGRRAATTRRLQWPCGHVQARRRRPRSSSLRGRDKVQRGCCLRRRIVIVNRTTTTLDRSRGRRIHKIQSF